MHPYLPVVEWSGVELDRDGEEVEPPRTHARTSEPTRRPEARGSSPRMIGDFAE